MKIKQLFVITLGLLLAATAAASDKEVGKIMLAKGAVTAKSPDGSVAFLGKDMPIYEGDVLSTGGKAFAVVNMSDGTRMTLRPNTVFGIDKFSHNEKQEAKKESALLTLFRGGLRAITGLISKRNPRGGYRINAGSATIGIRGTEFDARLCEASDCASETGSGPMTGLTRAPVVARVAWIKGAIKADDESDDKAARTVLKGGPLYAGDTITSGKHDIAVLVFKDKTRVTLKPDTRFKVEKYEVKEKPTDNIAFRLFRGGMRALTGLLGKRKPKGFTVSTSVATIGIRGTGFDISCEGECDKPGGRVAVAPGGASSSQCQSSGKASGLGQGDGLFLKTWKGATELQTAACTLVVNEGETAYVGTNGDVPKFTNDMPFLNDDGGPRPDKVDVDENLFATENRDKADPGLYVSVYDGHVVLENDNGQVIDLGKGEAGSVGGPGNVPVRLSGQPIFQVQDKFPRPEAVDENVEKVLDLLFEDIGGENAQCEIQ